MKKVSRNNTNRLRSLLKMFESVGFIVVLLLGATNIHAHTDHVFVSIEQLVKARKTTMLDVFKTIKEKTGYIFFYSEDIKAELEKEVTLKTTSGSIEDILKPLFVNSNLTFEINEKQVIIKQKMDRSVAPSIQQQPIELTGVVVDETGVPVIGANVLVKGTTMGIITDVDGKFILKVPANSTLVVSFIGYKTVEIKPGRRNHVSVELVEDTEHLEEVVIVGYGVQEKESVVGAITQVGNKSLVQSGVSDVTAAIAGKLSGVLTMQQSGQPGQTTNDIIIRGVSSWNSSKPLVMVDGVERDFADLDPNEINTISVLKDASATAVFGAKGANGVILVTTKRGVESKPKLDFSASYGIELPTRIPKHIDSYTTMSMYNVGLMNAGTFQDLTTQAVLNEYRNPSTPLNSIRYPDVDWFDVLARDFAPVTNANFNIRGGTNFVKYFASLGYYHQGSFFNSLNEGYCDTRYKYDRFNFRGNLDFDLTKSTVLSFNIGGDISIQNTPGEDPWRPVYQASTTLYPAYYPAWVLEQVPDLDYPDASGDRLAAAQNDARGNPYSALHQGKFNEYTSSKLFTDLILKQNLDMVTKGLSVQAKVSLSTYYKNKSLTANWSVPQYTLNFDKIGTGMNPWFREGEGNESWTQPPLDINVGDLEDGYYSNLYYEFSLDYKRSFGKHNVTALALMSRHQKNSGTDFAYYNESWVGRATYNFDKRYLLEVNIGYTGSERFAPSNRFGFFPSGAVGWVVSEEKFFKDNISWMNKLKFRYSDGKVGSDSASERWLYIGEYSANGNYIYEDKVPNIYAQWEEARKRDLGIEMAFLDNMITVGVDFFDEKRTHMLLNPQSNTMLIGNNGFKQLNKGSMKKHGLEVELGFNKTTSYGLSYNLKGIFGFKENRIIDKDDLPYSPEYKKAAGKPYGAQLDGALLTGSGYYTSVDDIHNNPAPTTIDKINVGDYKFLDYMADGKINTSDKYAIDGTLYPPITFSLSGGFSYKNFDFSILFQGNSGKYVEYNEAFEAEFTSGSLRVHESQLDYWTPTNPNANHSTLHYVGQGNPPLLSWGGGDAWSGYGIKIKDRFWRKADYIRLKEVYLGYNIKPKYLKKWVGISAVTVYASGNNLFTITSLLEGDPERKDFARGFYPQMSTYKVGLKVAF